MAAEVRTEATRRLRTRETKRDQEKQVAYRRRLQTMFASSDTEHQSPQQIREQRTGKAGENIPAASAHGSSTVHQTTNHRPLSAIRSITRATRRTSASGELSSHRRRLEALPNLLRPSPRQHPPHKPLDLDRGLGTPAGRFLPLMRLFHQPIDQHLHKDGVLANRSWHGKAINTVMTGQEGQRGLLTRANCYVPSRSTTPDTNQAKPSIRLARLGQRASSAQTLKHMRTRPDKDCESAPARARSAESPSPQRHAPPPTPSPSRRTRSPRSTPSRTAGTP